MKKTLLVLLVTIVTVSLFIASCGEPAPTSTPSPTASPSPSPTASPSPSPTASPSPSPTASPSPSPTASPTEDKYGGHLRIITGAGNTPQNIGFYPKQQFGDATVATIWSDRILNLDTKGDFTPSVAEGYEMSSDLMTITIHLRDDVTYQDGTPLNAESVAWSFQTAKDAGALAGGKRIDRIEVADEYTVKVYLNVPNNQVIYDLARVYLYSPTAYDKEGEEWAINHSVSTSAFQTTDFQRDVVLKMEKYDDYWREGYPYLDSAELITVKDPTTASAMMQAGQADIWVTTPAQQASELQDLGFTILETPTTAVTIYCESKNPESPFADKRVREAIEYAIDREAMAEALGFGFMIPIYQPGFPNTAGYNPDYPVREYNIDKAKELLAEAGYGSGIKTKLMVMQGSDNQGAIVQAFLAEVGIDAEVDVADVGRFWGSINGGWEGLLVGPYAQNPEFIVAWLHHFGPEPIMQFTSMAKSQEYLDLCEKVVIQPDIESMRKVTMDVCTQAGLDVMFIPLTLTIGTSTATSNFHTSYYQDLDWTYWSVWDDWME